MSDQPTLHETALRAEKHPADQEARELNQDIATLQGWRKVSYGQAGHAWHDTMDQVNKPMFMTDYAQSIGLVPQGWIMKILRSFDDDGDYWSVVILTDSFSTGRGMDLDDLVQVRAEGPGEPPQFITSAALKAQALQLSKRLAA